MDYLTNDTDLKKVADAIRAKGNTTDPLAYPDEFVTAIGNIQAGGGSAAEGDITFYDYEGTIVESWTLAELATKTALPAYPSHEGLICQGWNWSLADLKSTNRKMNVGAMYITDDGKTRIYIHLEEGRTSPMLGVCPNGTVTVDWGDGTTPDTLTGTSTSTVKWTPTHNYAAPGDYVIKLTVSGTMGFYGSATYNQYGAILRYSSGTDPRNQLYHSCVKRLEVGDGVGDIGSETFWYCYALTSITLPNSVTNIGNRAFMNCYALTSITLPNSVTNIGTRVFMNCYALTSVSIPSGVTSVGQYVFYNNYSLTSVSIPEGVTSIGSDAFSSCYALTSVSIPEGVTSIGSGTFNNCSSLTSIAVPNGVTSILEEAFYSCRALVSLYLPNSLVSIPDDMLHNCCSLTSVSIPEGVTSIGSNAFSSCYALTSVSIPEGVTSIGSNAFDTCQSITSIAIPNGVSSIEYRTFWSCTSLGSVPLPGSITTIAAYSFSNCYSVAFYDFSNHTAVPTLANTNAFTGIAADCEIRVPAALVDEWKAATNWATYADHIVGV